MRFQIWCLSLGSLGLSVDFPSSSTNSRCTCEGSPGANRGRQAERAGWRAPVAVVVEDSSRASLKIIL
eukprot:6153038-Pyramimonas_sp.AAC.1